MIRPPCEITDQLAVGIQNCFSTLFYTPYTNIKTSAQNAPKCTIARQKKSKKFLGRGHSPTGEGDTSFRDPTPLRALILRAFTFLFIYDSNTEYIELICDTTVIDLPASPKYCCYTTLGIQKVNQSYTLPLHKILKKYPVYTQSVCT